jgi:hypothetical protein
VIRAVAFVPAAPLLVPDAAGGSAEADADLRDASIAATRRLTESGAQTIYVIAPVSDAASWPGDATWDFAGFGLAPRAVSAARLPWQLGIGAWLLDQVSWRGGRRYLAAAADAAADAEPDPREPVAVLAVGDGSACRTEKAPGYLDDRAAGFDERVAAILTAGQPGGFDAVDEQLAKDLMCSGLPVWHRVAALAGGARPATALLDLHDARYGVGYFVAFWQFG